MTLKMQVILAVALLVAGAVGGFAITTHYHSTQEGKAEQEANVAKEQAIVARALAEQKEQEVAVQKAAVVAAEAKAKDSDARYQRLLAQHTQAPPLPPMPDTIPADCQPVYERCKAAEEQLAEANAVVASGTLVLNDSKAQVKELKAALGLSTQLAGHWKKAADEERKRAACLEVALEAQKALTKQALWKGRWQGLAIGIGGGYLLGHR